MLDGWRRWDPLTAVALGDTSNMTFLPTNNLDERNRAWSPDTIEICKILNNHKMFWNGNVHAATKAAYRIHLGKAVLRVAGATIVIGFSVCAIATAVCTGVGAVSIAKEAAFALLRAGVSISIQQVYLQLTQTQHLVESMQNRILALEEKLADLTPSHSTG